MMYHPSFRVLAILELYHLYTNLDCQGWEAKDGCLVHAKHLARGGDRQGHPGRSIFQINYKDKFNNKIVKQEFAFASIGQILQTHSSIIAEEGHET